MIECKLCHKFYKSVTNTHLKKAHNITSNEYLGMFPGSVLSSKRGKTWEEFYGNTKAEEIRGKKSGKNHPLYEKTYEEYYGEDQAKGIKQKQRKGIKKRMVDHPHYARLLYGKTYEERFGKEKAEEIRQKHRESMLGEDNPSKRVEVRKKISEANSGENNGMKGRVPEIKDKTYEEYYGLEKAMEIKRKLCVARLGENHWNWQGGISNFPYSFEFNEEFKTFIRERDNYTCQLCGRTKEEEGMNLTVHHIYYDKENTCLDESDFTALCRSCNSKVNFNREYWTKFFQQKIELRFCVVS